MRGIEQLALQFRFHLVIPLTVIFVILRRKRMTIYWKTIQIAFTSSSLFIVSCFKHQNCSVLIRSDYIVQLSKKKKNRLLPVHIYCLQQLLFLVLYFCVYLPNQFVKHVLCCTYVREKVSRSKVFTRNNESHS